MAHFIGYSTEDPAATQEGWVPLAGSAEEGHEYIGPAMQTDRAQRIAGSVFADQAGTLLIQQTFDGENWDISTSVSVTASTGTKFSEEIIAPQWRLKFTNTGTKQKKFRLFARAFVTGA